MVSRVVDSGTEQLKTFASETDWSKLVYGAARETSKSIIRQNKPPAITLDGVAASNYLEMIIPAVEKTILSEHAAYGDFRWLWYLRRIPEELLSGCLNSTFAYDLALAEAIVSEMAEVQIDTQSTRIQYPINKHIFRHICRFVGKIKLLSHLHITYRKVGKGGTLSFQNYLPEANNARSVKDAILLYDQRHEEAQGSLGIGLGLSPLEADYSKIKNTMEKQCLHFTITPNCAPIMAPTKYPNEDGEIIDIEIHARYFLSIVEIEKVLNPYSEQENKQWEINEEYLPLFQFLLMLYIFMLKIPWAIGSMLSWGYFFAKKEISKELFDSYLPEVNSILENVIPGKFFNETFESWYAASSQIKSEAWPPRAGKIVKIYNDDIVFFDTASATQALFKLMEVDKTLTNVGNLRADQFEIQCQRIINDSNWHPPANFLSIRGRTLRQEGKNLTDIDAIGINKDTLLLVSCKSVVYDGNYDRGKYSTIRNVQSTIDSAVAYWMDLVHSLRSNPIGDNFDFSEVESIVGVVCTPFAVYSNSEQTLSYVEEGLRACVSSDELGSWLSR